MMRCWRPVQGIRLHSPDARAAMGVPLTVWGAVSSFGDRRVGVEVHT